MATIMTAEQRRKNLDVLKHFRLGKQKIGLMDIRDGDGQPVVNAIKMLAVLYVEAAYAGDVTHKEAMAYALEEIYDHLGGIGGYRTNGNRHYWEPITQGKLRFALAWFTTAMNWRARQMSYIA